MRSWREALIQCDWSPTLRFCHSPRSAQDGGRGGGGSSMSLCLWSQGTPPLTPASLPHFQSLCLRESFLISGPQAVFYISEHSHNSVTLFLLFRHKHLFSFSLRFELWNKSQKMPVFLFRSHHLFPKAIGTQLKAWGWPEGAMAIGS